VGGHGEPVGVRDPFARNAGSVLRQGVDASRRVTAEPAKRGGVLRVLMASTSSASPTIASLTRRARWGAWVVPHLL
jgi:hypothetical protein